MTSKLLIAAVIATGAVAIGLGVDAPRPIVSALMIVWIIAGLWVSEILHITITALLVPLLAVGLGLMDVSGALASFANPVIFLFLGGFALAAAMRLQGLDAWLASGILRFTHGRLDRAMVLLALMTGLISMWISNTAATAMVLPMALGLLAQKPDLCIRTQAFSLLAIAYSASVGGIGTLVGTPPNAIVAAELGMTFLDWMVIGVPLVILLWPLMMVVLYLMLRPDFQQARVDIDHPQALEWTPQRCMLLGIFALTVAGWLLGRPLGQWLGVTADMDTVVALVAILLLAVTGVARWQDMEKSTEWGVLLLFGGGLTLNALLKSSGASAYLGLELAELVGGWSELYIVLALVAFVVFFSEFTSNTATAALLIPVFVALPGDLLNSTQAALAIGIAASTAFMMPVGTPPNALVHGTGKVEQRTMIRAGFAINLMCIAVLTVVFSQLY